MARRLDQRDSDFEAAFQTLVEARREDSHDVRDAVASIIADVRNRGDAALFELTARYDRIELDRLVLTADEIEALVAEVDAADLEALKLAAERIRRFHELQRPADIDYVDGLGIAMGLSWHAIEHVGLYVPGGTAAYPSSVLMNAIPARVAGCRRLVVTVPTPDGIVSPLVIAAAKLSGVDEIWRLGGAQAVAAMAYGTAGLDPVDKIAGPGNAWVAEAKRQVFGRVGIDMVAGPSEVVIVADGANDPEWIAADLLAQAEHDERAQSILITDDPEFADAVSLAVETQLERLQRNAIASVSWAEEGAVIVVDDLENAPRLINPLAPEHLQLCIADPAAMRQRITNAGSIFEGASTPEVVGDYVGGPNHVLPTGRTARFASGLSVYDFMKRTTYLSCSADALAEIGPAAARLARAEGLDAHARAIELRLERGD